MATLGNNLTGECVKVTANLIKLAKAKDLECTVFRY